MGILEYEPKTKMNQFNFDFRVIYPGSNNLLPLANKKLTLK